MRYSPLPLLILACSFLIGPPLPAQPGAIPQVIGGLNLENSAPNGKERDPMEQLCTHLSARLQQGLDIRIEAMDRVCALREDQKKTLEVATKGAVDRALEQWRKTLNENNPGIAQQVIQNQKHMGLDEAISAWCGFPPDPADEAVWINAVSQALDKNQSAKWLEAKDQRFAQFRDLAVGQAMFRIDRKLFLAADQKKKVRALVEEHLAEHLAEIGMEAEKHRGAGQGLAAQMRIQMLGMRGGRGGGKKVEAPKIPEDKLAEILTEAQQLHWPEVHKTLFHTGQQLNNFMNW